MPSVLRIKNPDGTWYEVTALKGDTGITPNLQVGTVTTGNPGTSAEVTLTGTPEEPVLNLKIPKGDTGATGPAGANGKDYVLTEADKQEIAGMVKVPGGVGAAIDDTTPSTTTTYSSRKIESVVSALNQANAQQDTEIAKKANDADLAKVAKSGSYDDLTGKPTIPTVPSALPNPNALTFTGAVNETYDGSTAKSVAIPTVPESLKNPNKLTFTGAVTAEYDGSTAVEVTIPEGGSGSYTLPIASPSTLGGVMPAAKTDEMTQAVGVDGAGGLWALPGGEKDWTKICGGNITGEVASIVIDANADGTPISNLDINEMVIMGRIYLTGDSNVRYEYNGLWTSGNYFTQSKLGAWSHAFIIHIARYLDRWCVKYNGGTTAQVITPTSNFTSFEMHTETDGVLFGTGTNLNVYYR